MKKITCRNPKQSKVVLNLLLSICLAAGMLLTTNAFAASVLVGNLTGSIVVSEEQNQTSSDITIPPSGKEYSGGGILDPQSGIGDTVSYEISGNADPFIGFSFSVMDSGNPSTFGMTLTMPMVPSLNASVNWSADLSATLTQVADTNTGGNTVALTTVNSSGSLTDFVIEGLSVTGLGHALSGAGTYPFSASGTYAGGSSPYDFMGIALGFTGTGGGNEYLISGTWTITEGQGNPAVPEPTTLLLLGCGLLGIAAIRRKHASRAKNT